MLRPTPSAVRADSATLFSINDFQSGFSNLTLELRMANASQTPDWAETPFLPFLVPEGAWVADPAISFASLSVSGRPTGPIPSICRPGLGAKGSGPKKAWLPLKSKSPRARLRSPCSC